jgi:anthranilate phosphoribosyltransferase
MKVWAPVRADLGLRTIFNLLGPLTNPAGVKRQLVGVFAKTWVEPVAKVLRNLGSEHAWVVHGHDGMDELTTTGPTTVAELKGGNIKVFDVTPEDAGLGRASLADLKGGDAKLNATALRGVLSGNPGAYRDIVVLNTAAALIVAGRARTLSEGAALAAAAIASGKAMQALDGLVAATNGSN